VTAPVATPFSINNSRDLIVVAIAGMMWTDASSPVASTAQDCAVERRIVARITRTGFQRVLP